MARMQSHTSAQIDRAALLIDHPGSCFEGIRVASLSMSCCVRPDGNSAQRADVDRHIFVHPQHKGTRVLKTPIHIRNVKMRLEQNSSGLRLRSHYHLHGMVVPMKAEDPIHVEAAANCPLKFSLDMR